MSFQTRCPFCQQQARVPDEALAGSGRCPRCQSYFTLVPDDSVAKLPSQQQAAMACVLPATRTDSGRPTVHDDASPRSTLDKSSTTSNPRPADDAGKSLFVANRQRIVGAIGPGALLLGGAGLVCASFNATTVLTTPMSVSGFLVGVIGAFCFKSLPIKGRLILACGLGVSGLVATAALLRPGLLGPSYQHYRQHSMSDPMVIRRIPLVGSVGASRSDEWVDASQLALQQDQVRVQVTQVAIGPIESASNSKKKENQKNYLQIRLRTYRVQDSNAFVANRFESPYPRADKPRPTVTDRSGMVHQPLNLLSAESAEQYRRSTVFPVSIVDDVFIFDAFPLDDADVRLEIPTAAWGGVGAFRFRIPNAMIRRNATPQVGSVGGARER